MAEETKNLEGDSAFMDRNSRQIGAYGMETMAKLVRMDVLVVGLKGVGIETAKNLCLAGPRSVTLYDPNPVKVADLGSNFYLTEECIGQPRAASVAGKLKELNKSVDISVATELNEEVVGSKSICVFTNTPKDELIRWNNFCRTHTREVKDDKGGRKSVPAPIGFILCDVRGVMGYMFSDFGDNFVIRDDNGEAPVVRVIQDITCAEEGVVTVLLPPDGRRHNIPTGDEHAGFIEFSGVTGMEAKDEATRKRFGASLNESGVWAAQEAKRKVKRMRTVNGERKQVEVSVTDAYRLTIGDTRGFTPYQGGGVFTQVRQPVVRHYKSLAQKLMQPSHPMLGMTFTDGSKFGRPEQLHMAVMGVMCFEQEQGRMPAANNEDDIKAVQDAAVAFNENMKKVAAYAGSATAMSVDEVELDVVAKVARYAALELQPMCAFYGGVVAQEVVKLAGKFTPLNQWLHIDAFEVLPDELPADNAPLGCRYDDMIQIFGKAFQDKLGDEKTFMVGCGALGCEFLKNFAMLGVACGDNGLITVTDNDRIEVSNLSRQFLFRESNVGQPKSRAAGESVTSMNPAIKVNALELLVHAGTENTFHSAFWEGQNFITNALDNVKAREYVDGRCVFYEKPLLESGTLGTKCNVQVIVPHLTASYTDIKDGEEEDHIPMCTLRNFPSLIEHCIEWARAQFTDMFVAPCNHAKKLVQDREAFLKEVEKSCIHETNAGQRNSSIATELPVLRMVKSMVVTAKTATFETCVKQAYHQFNADFRNRILQLIHNYPEDAVNSEGEKFWSGAKRFPCVGEYSPENAHAMAYLIATANLFAVSYGLVPPPEEQLLPRDHAWRQAATVAAIVAAEHASAPEFVPVSASAENVEDAEAEMGLEELKTLISELRALDLEGINLEPADFEKDQDLNFHIDFVTAASNLRASNYHITNATRHKCKMIAGKIIPAIATTTASVTGLVMIEMLKVIQKKPLEAYRDSSNSLGINGYFFSEPPEVLKTKDEYDPIEMAEVKCKPTGFTKWDKTVVNITEADTLKQFLAKFKEVTGLNCTLICHAVSSVPDTPQSGKFLYDKTAWKPAQKELFASKMDVPFLDWIRECYGEEVIAGATYCMLDISCEDDDEEAWKVPTLLLKWA